MQAHSRSADILHKGAVRIQILRDPGRLPAGFVLAQNPRNEEKFVPARFR